MTLCVVVAVRPRLSVTVSLTTNVPAAAYVWNTVRPEAVVLSPRDQSHVWTDAVPVESWRGTLSDEQLINLISIADATGSDEMLDKASAELLKRMDGNNQLAA